MDTLDWSNPSNVQAAKTFFDKYVTAWNPRDIHRRNIMVHRSLNDDPCLLNSEQILSSNAQDDYEHLLNRVQRHTKCSVDSCLRKKGSILKCRYNAPWEVRDDSILFIDEKGKKKYEPARNDDRLNVHNVDLLAMWRANVDCQPVVSRHVVLKYIAKYASKAEKRSESYQDMLSRISNASGSEAPVLCAYRRFLAETLVDRDIGAQETCHMLLKLPLVVCSRKFFSLNVGRKVFKKVSNDPHPFSSPDSFLEIYQNRPSFLDHLSMIEIARSWTFDGKRKKEPWKHRYVHAIVRVWPRFYSIPSEGSDEFETFCWTELLLYKPFRNIPNDIGLSSETVIENWRNFRYRAWHVDRSPTPSDTADEDEDSHEEETIVEDDFEEWQVLSRLIPPNNITISDLQTLGRREFDICFNWDQSMVSNDVAEEAIHFIKIAKSRGDIVENSLSTIPSPTSLSEKQRQAFEIILRHSVEYEHREPLHMIIQGTAGTGKSFLIHCISHALSASVANGHSPLLLLAPTGIAAFNIHAKTIHSALKIPIKDMRPLQGQSLAIFQEEMKHIRYILIDEMSFLGPRLFIQIDSRLREAFPDKKTSPFGGISIILVGDLGQLPPVKDKPLYAGNTAGKVLWKNFNIVVTLDIIFRQQGNHPRQAAFRQLLSNIRNVEPVIDDWDLLMSRVDMSLPPVERSLFHSAIHLFPTNDLVTLHNRQMLKSLNTPIARSVAEHTRRAEIAGVDDDQLEREVLLCPGQRVMLTCNLWVEAGLVNGALGYIQQIYYSPGTKPPQLPMFTTVLFDKYIGVPFDKNNLNIVPITPITRGNRKQIPLKMAWALTIHKSQGLTLDRATIDIGKKERQGLTFTSISRVKSIDGLRISPPFSFQRYAKMKNSAYVTIRKKEEQRLHSLSL
jgi:ATP-dependent DNA helicase PIF1